jgi:hypothetical protein
VKRSTLIITGVIILVLSVFSVGSSGSSTPPSDPPPSSDSSDDVPPPPEEEGDEGFGVRCC